MPPRTLQPGPGSGIAPADMSATLDPRDRAELALHSDPSPGARQRMAARDVREGFLLWRLFVTLGWLDIRQRYRGSLLGPFWLTLSTGVMVASLGVLYSALFKLEPREYIPFLALSMVLWGYVSAVVGDACHCFTQAEGMIRSIRMPYTLHAARTVVRNLLVLAHNVLVIVAVYAAFDVWPGWRALWAMPGLALWVVDGLAACMLLGALCARFRDISPIVGSLMQIAFFITPVIWKPELLQDGQGGWLPFNPFYSVLEVVRAPLLGGVAGVDIWMSALVYSALLLLAAWLVFSRVRARLAFWV